MLRPLSIVFLILLIFGLLIAAYNSDRLVFDLPQEKVDYYTEKLGRQIAQKHDVLLLLTFDEPQALEWASGAQVNQVGVESTSGRYGQARLFNGSQYNHIETSLNWRQLGKAYTISIWLNLEDTSPEQDIIFTSFNGRYTGIRLEDGRMTFHVPGSGLEQHLSYTYASYGRYTHIAAIADLEAGMAFIYENGVLRSSRNIEAIEQPRHNIEMGKRNWYTVRNQLFGSIDEVIIWNRAFSPHEVSEIFSSRSSLLKILSPEYYRKWKIAKAVERGIHATLKVVDYFHPGLHEGRIRAADLHEINLILSKKDHRHFNRNHNKSLASGRRVDKAADRRSISYVINGKAGHGFLRLDGSNTSYAEGFRKSFVMELQEHDESMGIRIIRLSPPEHAGFFEPLLETQIAQELNIPHIKNGLCRLMVNGNLIGVYYFEDLETLGVFPGQLGKHFKGPANVQDRSLLFRRVDDQGFIRVPFFENIPIPRETLLGIYDFLHDIHHVALINDTKSPLSSRTISRRLGQDRFRLVEGASLAPEKWTPARKLANVLNEYMVLGDNPSPFFLLSDLHLDVLHVPGVQVQWRSSHPDVLTHEGKLIRPQGDRPVQVEMTAVISDDVQTLTRAFIFRAMPEILKIPALMLSVSEPLSKLRRVDCLFHYYDQHGDGTPHIFYATQGSGGGAKFRGNTSFWRSTKKPFSLRLDEAHYLLDQTTTKHLFFGTGIFDSSFMRNKLSYDMFRSFAREDAPRFAPQVKWAEVFVNGRYHGLYEMGTRVQRRMLGFESYRKKNTQHAVLYKHVAPSDIFRQSPPSGFIQKMPQISYQGPYLKPYNDLTQFTGFASQEKFIREFNKWMDLENIIDFQILLNVTQNLDGNTVNLYLARDNKAQDLFFIVPWDYDHTFRDRGRWLSNHLFDRLICEYPGYSQLLNDRWQELRNHQLREDRLMNTITAMERDLSGFVEWDSARWPRKDERSYQEHVQQLRENVRKQLKFCDERIEAIAEGG